MNYNFKMIGTQIQKEVPVLETALIFTDSLKELALSSPENVCLSTQIPKSSFAKLFSKFSNFFKNLKTRHFFKAGKKENENFTVNSRIEMPEKGPFCKQTEVPLQKDNQENDTGKQPAIFGLLFSKLKNKKEKLKRLIRAGIDLNQRNCQNVS